jgi:hypothetical protein
MDYRHINPLSKLKQFWKNNLDEITQDKGLVFFGFLLAITHVIHFIYYHPGMARLMGKGSDGVCLPFIPGCTELRFLSAEQVGWVINGYGFFAIVTAVLFFFSSRQRLAVALLLFLQVFKNFIIFHDARLYSAHNYITNFLTVLFVLAPRKRNSIKILFVLVYFWSGIMHLNPQWLDGTLVRNGWIFFPSYLEYQTVYVVILQILFSWFLLSGRTVLFWTAFAQFVLFHLISYTVIQWLYPTIMLVLLLGLVGFRLLGVQNEKPVFIRSKVYSSDIIVLSLFSFLQLIPRLLPTKLQLYGDGRFFYSMHQYNAGIECVSESRVIFKSGRTEQVDLLAVLPFLHPRLRCEPVVTEGAAKAICKKFQNDSDFDRLDVKLKSKLQGSSEDFETIIDKAVFCKSEGQ